MPKNKENLNRQVDKDRILDDSMQRALKKAQGEMPNVKNVSVNPRGSSLLTKYFMPRGANAVTNPFTGNITYNPEMMQNMRPDEIEQTMRHEMTHVGQTQNTPWWKTAMEIFKPDEIVPPGQTFPLNDPYYWRPREMEAFQAERDYAFKNKTPNYVDPVLGTRDIMLRPDVGPTPNTENKMLETTGKYNWKKDPQAVRESMQSMKGNDLYFNALAKMKEGIPLTPQEQAAFKKYKVRK